MKDNYLFELSWEVCNKVGGIYTVITSKADLVNKEFTNYFLIGPYFEKKAKFEFQEEDAHNFNGVFEQLKNEGIICHYGKWLIKGSPKVILIDFNGYVNFKNKIKKDLWDNYNVDSLFSQWDFEEPVIWATAAGRLIELIRNTENKKIVLHCHEWLSGAALLYVKSKNLNVGTVFTTHATALGRSLCSNGFQLYDLLDNLSVEDEAKKNKIIDKHTIEKASALNCDIFTTVSEITAMEAEKILERKADVITLNGLDMDKFPSFEITSIEHQKNRETMREFISYYFFPNYYFNLENTLNFFIVGRYEFKNKGIDIFIKSLGKLNEIMKQENSEKNIIVFFWIPRDVLSAKYKVAKNKMNYHLLRHFIEQNSAVLNRKIIENLLQCMDQYCKIQEGNININELFGDDFSNELRKLRLNFVTDGDPPIVTHNLANENDDILVKSLLENGLDNKSDDKVKVIFYPVYLTGVDGLLDMEYYDCISGCHFGLFPSYYEPWGYTPLESAALGVPSLTTDLGGFGRFLLSQNQGNSGVFVLKRFKKPEDEIVNEFTKILHNYTKLSQKGRVEQKLQAKKLASLADWNEFVKLYFKSYELALKGVKNV